MTRRILASGFACAVALTATVAAQSTAQTTPTQTQPAPSVASPSADQSPAMVSVEGCVVREYETPGRKPPEEMEQRIKDKDDYILTDTKVVKGSAPSAPAPSSSSEAVGTSGVTPSSLMYFIEDIDKGQLKDHVGHRVQIDGNFTNIDRAKNPVAYGTDLVEIHGTTIRQVPGTCPEK